MGWPGFYICESRGADQLFSNSAAGRRLCYFATQIVLSLYFLYPKFQTSGHFLWLYSSVVSDLVGNPKGEFSCVAAHTRHVVSWCGLFIIK